MITRFVIAFLILGVANSSQGAMIIWDDLSALSESPSGTFTGSVANVDGTGIGLNVTISYFEGVPQNGPPLFGDPSPKVDATLGVQPLTSLNFSVNFGAFGTLPDPEIVVTLSFTEAINLESLDILDIDSQDTFLSEYRDIVEVNGFFNDPGMSSEIDAEVTATGATNESSDDNMLLGAGVVAAITNQSAGELTNDGNATFAFGTPVDTIQIRYSHIVGFTNNPTLQWIGIGNTTFSTVTPIPEPSSMALLAISLLTGAGYYRSRKGKQTVQS